MKAEKQLTASLENYIEVVYRIVRQKGVARVKEIAKAMSVRMPSVNSALKILQERGLVEHSRYGYVELTACGEAEAQKVFRHHETLTDFLHEVIGASRETAEQDACKIEHVISRDTFERVLALVEFLQSCPPEDRAWLTRYRDYCEKGPLPGGGQALLADADEPGGGRNLVSLAAVSPGQRAMVQRLLGVGPIHQRMLDMGVVPGTPVLVERTAPMGDPIEVKIRGYHLSLRREEAAKIKVLLLKDREMSAEELAADRNS